MGNVVPQLMGNVVPQLMGSVAPQETGANSLGTCKNAGVCAGGSAVARNGAGAGDGGCRRGCGDVGAGGGGCGCSHRHGGTAVQERVLVWVLARRRGGAGARIGTAARNGPVSARWHKKTRLSGAIRPTLFVAV